MGSTRTHERAAARAQRAAPVAMEVEQHRVGAAHVRERRPGRRHRPRGPDFAARARPTGRAA
jgi:hypothetical protein